DSQASERLDPALLVGQLRVAHEELLERDRRGHSAGEEARRSIADVLPRVRCPTRDEHERSRRRLMHVVSELDPEPAFQDPDELVLIPVQVKRRSFSGQRDRIDRRQHSTTLIAHDLEGQDSADGILDRHACPRGECERLHLWSAMISGCHCSAAQPLWPAHTVNLALIRSSPIWQRCLAVSRPRLLSELLSGCLPTAANTTKEGRNELEFWWARLESNQRPADYESAALNFLASCLTSA